METGQLIRKYRKMRGMTQMGLAERCGLSDSAIRNYELGNRMPSEAHLEMIAEALEIAPEALREVRVDSARQALEYLFRIDEEFGLKPVWNDEGNVLLAVDPENPNAPKFSAALKTWIGKLDMLKKGETTQVEYEAWKASLE